jgi:hypothetical protein
MSQLYVTEFTLMEFRSFADHGGRLVPGVTALTEGAQLG